MATAATTSTSTKKFPATMRIYTPKYRYVRVHHDTENTFVIVIFTKNASFRSYDVICLPMKPPTTLKPQTTDTKGIS